MTPLNSLVVPVYNSVPFIPRLLAAVAGVERSVQGGLETIFVVDGSPDASREMLLEQLPATGLRARVVDHSRNFGAFNAIRTGMRASTGQYIAVMAADLQEPPELVIAFLDRLASGDVDVVAGERASRDDRGDAASGLYWWLYRRFVMDDIPVAGVDVFACTAQVRDVVCALESVNTSLVAQLFWVGFRREMVPYHRLSRPGESGWTLSKKLQYTTDSVFAFTDLPVRLLWIVGIVGLVLGVGGALAVFVLRIAGTIRVPGYAATIIVVLLFLSINSLGLGIIGSYVWRVYETVKGRPGAIVADETAFAGREDR